MTQWPVPGSGSLLRQLCAGTHFECQFGVFDDGPVVGVEVPGPFGIGLSQSRILLWIRKEICRGEVPALAGRSHSFNSGK
jgi:hypothetical protein